MESSVTVPVGLSLIGCSLVLQVVCFTLTCCLTRKRHGGQTISMRSWLFIASTFDQMTSLIFHLQYHYYIFPISSIKFCIILRVISSFASTFTMMWIVMLSVFYFISTLHSAKRVFLNSHFLSHCVTWSWSVIGCVIYVIVTFLTENGGRSYLHETCWMNIGDTVHLYFSHGYEAIALLSMVACTIITRCRTSSRLHFTCKQSKPNRLPDSHLEYDVNTLLFLSVFLCLYYCALFSRLLLYTVGSDLSLMVIHAVKGFLIAMFMCFLNKSVIGLLRGDLPVITNEYSSRRSQGSFVSNSSLRAMRSSNTSKFIFD